MNFTDLFFLLVPEVLVVLTAFAVVLADLMWMRQRPPRSRARLAALLTTAGCLVTMGWLTQVGQPGKNLFFEGVIVLDQVVPLLKQLLLALTVFTALITVGATFTDHVGEYFALLLLATAGMMFLVASENILMIFLALELVSLCLYVITAFAKHSRQSAEAALKYFLFGSIAAAVMLFGLSLLYGLSGSLNLVRIAEKLRGPSLDPLAVLAMVMVVSGLGFKIAAVPFHLWAPDTYEGAPTPAAAFIASGSKVASFIVLARVAMVGFAGAGGSAAWRQFAPGWLPLLAILAALSILLGNLAALAQTRVRRLLAYSAIAHAGYALTGLLANNESGLASLIFYATTYALTALGAFGVVAVVQEAAGGDGFEAFAGLSRRAPLLSFCMLVFLLSLAGIPPLVGFFGKFYLFTVATAATKNLGLLWLVILGIAMSAVSLYYYLQVLKQIYVAEPPPAAPPLAVPVLTRLAIVLLTVGVIALGCAPHAFLGRLPLALNLPGA